MKRLKKRKWLSRLKDWPEWKKQWAKNLLVAFLPIMFLIFIPMFLNSLHSSKIHIGEILFKACAGGEIVMCAIAILISTKPPAVGSRFNGWKWGFIALFSLVFGLYKSQALSPSDDYAPNFWVVIISVGSILVSALISFLMMKPENDSRKDETSMSGEQGGQGRNGVQPQTEVPRGEK